MSSILDALNKLEQEKAQAQRDREQAQVDHVSAAHDLVGRSVWRDRVTFRLSPSTLVLSGLLMAIALIAVSIAIALITIRALESDTQPTVTAAAAVQAAETPVGPEPITATPPADGAAPVSPAPNASQPASESPPPAVPAEADAFQEEEDASDLSVAAAESTKPAEAPSSRATPPDPVPEREVVASVSKDDMGAQVADPVRPEPPGGGPDDEGPMRTEAMVESSSQPEPPATPERNESKITSASTETWTSTRERMARREDDDQPLWSSRRVPGPSAENPDRAADEALHQLPVLTAVEQSRYGFERLTVNMVKPASDTNPQGSAIMTVHERDADGSTRRNTIPFYEGERIQRSNLRLFKVERQGIGLEDVRTGERYQMPF